MTPLRHVPPVHSPLSWEALRSGLDATRSLRRTARAEAEVLELLRTRLADASVVFTDSGTSALTLAMRLTESGRGRPVALPAFGCFDLATAVDGARRAFQFYDVDPATLAPDEQSLRRVLATGVGTVVVAHLYGVPVDTTRVRELATAAGALVIDDAAQGIGASLGDAPLGLGGALGILSFGRGKGLTGGGGGALVVPRGSPLEAAAAALRVPARQGNTTVPLAKGIAQWLLARPALYGVPARLPFLGLGETRYRAATEPVGISAFSLGVLRSTLALAAKEDAARRANAQRLMQAIALSPLQVPRAPQGSIPGWLRLPVVVPPQGIARARSGAARRLGILPSYPSTLADLPVFGARRLHPDEPLEGARLLAGRLFTLPTHGRLAPGDLSALEAWIRGLR